MGERACDIVEFALNSLRSMRADRYVHRQFKYELEAIERALELAAPTPGAGAREGDA